jgi:acyl-CoA thioester hydrolase
MKTSANDTGSPHKAGITHSFKLRIYYEDTDAGGIVYHSNYLNFGERARTEMIRDAGLTNSDIRDEYGIIIVVRHIDINYTAPARLEDELIVSSTVEEISRTSFLMKQVIAKHEQICATLLVKLVCVDLESGKAARIPEKLMEIFR